VTDVYLVVIILLVLMFYWLFSIHLLFERSVRHYFLGPGSAHSWAQESGPPKT